MTKHLSDYYATFAAAVMNKMVRHEIHLNRLHEEEIELENMYEVNFGDKIKEVVDNYYSTREISYLVEAAMIIAEIEAAHEHNYALCKAGATT